MKTSFSLTLLLQLTAAILAPECAFAQSPVTPTKPGWQLVWNDEFDGKELDQTKWKHRYLGKRESSMIAKECVTLDGKGNLLMTVFEKDGVLQNPMIGTQKLFSTTFGLFEARIKFPEMQGQHGSFWMQPAQKENVVDDAAKSGAEIDIIEWFGKGRNDGGIASNVYWPGKDGPKGHHAGGTKPFMGLKENESLCDDFHVFALEWTPDKYVFTIDGKPYQEINEGISHQPQYLILSLLTADWEKDRLDKAKLPNAMIVDWVRVWQKQVK